MEMKQKRSKLKLHGTRDWDEDEDGGDKLLRSHPSSFIHPQTICWALSMRTWQKTARCKESALCTCRLPSATPTQMPSTCGTRTTSSSPWLPQTRARRAALWWPSCRSYLRSFPPPSTPTARPTIIQSRRRAEAAWRIQDSFHEVHLLLTQFPLISLSLWFSSLAPSFLALRCTFLPQFASF